MTYSNIMSTYQCSKSRREGERAIFVVVNDNERYRDQVADATQCNQWDEVDGTNYQGGP